MHYSGIFSTPADKIKSLEIIINESRSLTIVTNLSILDVWGGPEYSSGLLIFRSSRPEVFCKKVVLRNFVKFVNSNQVFLFTEALFRFFQFSVFQLLPIKVGTVKKIKTLQKAWPLIHSQLCQRKSNIV